MRALSGRYERRPIFAIFPATSKTALGHHGEEARKRSLPRRGTLRAQLSSTFSLSGKSPHPWLRFDEHLWLTCRICEVRLRWRALVLSGIVWQSIERGTQGRAYDELSAITPQTGARNKTQ